jgi:hypothetical protein
MAVTAATVMVVSGARAASLGTLAASDLTCRASEPSLQMSVDASEAAAAVAPQRVRDATNSPATAPAGAEAKSRFHLNGQKYASPVGSRSEAGVAMSLGSHLSVQLNYARTAQVPMMGYSSDNGILARLRFGF